MRQNPKQWSICYVLGLLALGFLSIQLIHMNSSTLEIVETVELASSNPCTPSDNEVSVSISEYMSGQPTVLPQDDKRIVEYIRSKTLIESPSEKDYDLKEPKKDPSSGQGQYIRKILKDMKDGFFVECGALDGETRSNTLYMEKELNWKGLLIEGDPKNYALVKKKNRKAWISNTCLAIKPHPHTATFKQDFNVGKIVDGEGELAKPNHVTAQCVPLVSLLTAINVTTVDYFSLDVEGAELQVLKAIDFDKVFIRTLSVEIEWTVEGKDALTKFMETKGYKMVKHVHTHSGGFSNDYMYVHKDANIKIDEKDN